MKHRRVRSLDAGFVFGNGVAIGELEEVCQSNYALQDLSYCKRRGLCIKCGKTKTHARKATLTGGFQMIPLTKGGEAYLGQCLKCYTLEEAVEMTKGKVALERSYSNKSSKINSNNDAESSSISRILKKTALGADGINETVTLEARQLNRKVSPTSVLGDIQADAQTIQNMGDQKSKQDPSEEMIMHVSQPRLSDRKSENVLSPWDEDEDTFSKTCEDSNPPIFTSIPPYANTRSSSTGTLLLSSVERHPKVPGSSCEGLIARKNAEADVDDASMRATKAKFGHRRSSSAGALLQGDVLMNPKHDQLHGDNGEPLKACNDVADVTPSLSGDEGSVHRRASSEGTMLPDSDIKEDPSYGRRRRGLYSVLHSISSVGKSKPSNHRRTRSVGTQDTTPLNKESAIGSIALSTKVPTHRKSSSSGDLLLGISSGRRKHSTSSSSSQGSTAQKMSSNVHKSQRHKIKFDDGNLALNLDEMGRTTLHLILQCQSSKSTTPGGTNLQRARDSDIMAVIRSLPQSAAIPDCGNTYPLHLAVLNGHSLECVRSIFKCYPGAALERNTAGDTPLFLACQTTACAPRHKPGVFRTPDRVMYSAKLFNSSPLVVGVKTSKKHSNAHQHKEHSEAIVDRRKRESGSCRWEIIRLLLKYCPAAAAIRNRSGMSVLEMALQRKAPDDMIKLIVQSDESAVAIQRPCLEEGKITPLSLAVVGECSVDVIRTIAGKFPLALKMKDDFGVGPITAAWLRWYYKPKPRSHGEKSPTDINVPASSTSEGDMVPLPHRRKMLRVLHESKGAHMPEELRQIREKIETLLCASHHPDCVRSGNQSGVLVPPDGRPFRLVHAAAAEDCPVEILNLAALLRPEQIRQRDELGRLPLHIAASAPLYVKQAYEPALIRPIDFLVKFFPDAVRFLDGNNRLPLSVAVESGKKWDEGVNTIVSKEPRALRVRDARTKLYPFMAAAVRKDKPTPFIKWVARSRFKTKEWHGMTESARTMQFVRVRHEVELAGLTTVFHLLRSCPDVLPCSLVDRQELAVNESNEIVGFDHVHPKQQNSALNPLLSAPLKSNEHWGCLISERKKIGAQNPLVVSQREDSTREGKDQGKKTAQDATIEDFNPFNIDGFQSANLQPSKAAAARAHGHQLLKRVECNTDVWISGNPSSHHPRPKTQLECDSYFTDFMTAELEKRDTTSGSKNGLEPEVHASAPLATPVFSVFQSPMIAPQEYSPQEIMQHRRLHSCDASWNRGSPMISHDERRSPLLANSLEALSFQGDLRSQQPVSSGSGDYESTLIPQAMGRAFYPAFLSRRIHSDQSTSQGVGNNVKTLRVHNEARENMTVTECSENAGERNSSAHDQSPVQNPIDKVPRQTFQSTWDMSLLNEPTIGGILNPFDALFDPSLSPPTATTKNFPSNATSPVMEHSTPVHSGMHLSKFQDGQYALYSDSKGNSSQVKILKVHHDDDMQPFYTIQLANGNEKQTDDAHLEHKRNPFDVHPLTLTPSRFAEQCQVSSPYHIMEDANITRPMKSHSKEIKNRGKGAHGLPDKLSGGADYSLAKARDTGDDNSQLLCVVCMENKRQTMLLPCRHLCICSGCALLRNIEDCPLCKVKVVSTFDVLL